MNIFSTLFGSEKVISAGIAGIDKAFYTEEERAENLQKAMQLKVGLLNAYAAFKVAQRFLACIYSIPYITAWVITWGASFWVDVTTQYNMLIESHLAVANLIILAFYFAGGAAESVMKFKPTKIIKK